jgi:hypothetical protein
MIVKEETVYTEIYCSLKNDINDTLNSNENQYHFFSKNICFMVKLNRFSKIPLPTLPYIYSPLGARGAVGRRPMSESNFFSRLR